MKSMHCRKVAAAAYCRGAAGVFATMLAFADAGAADGYFDSAWPNGTGGGRITLTPGLASNIANDIAFRPDGSMVISLATSDSSGDFAAYTTCVISLTANGGYDYSFGPTQNGRACLNQFGSFPGKPSIGGRVLIQPDGKILVVGEYIDDLVNQKASAFVVRLTATGSLDTDAAGGAGYQAFQFGAADGVDASNAVSLALQADGKILVAGVGCVDAVAACNFDMGVARFTTQLLFDNTFNGNGRKLVGFDLGGSKSDVARDVLVQSDQKIVLAGTAQDATTTQAAIVRLDDVGAIDSGFGDQGRAHFLAGGSDLLVNSAMLDASGRILLAGSSNGKLVVARVRSDGVGLDGGYGGPGAGYSTSPAGTALIGFGAAVGAGWSDISDAAQGLALQSDGRIVVAGYAQLSNGAKNYNPFVVVRLLPDDGAIDTTFGITGKSFGLFSSSDVAASAFRPAFAPGARLMLVGTSTPPANSLTPSVGLGRLYTDLLFWGGFEPPSNDSN